jgi:hypothetical protein
MKWSSNGLCKSVLPILLLSGLLYVCIRVVHAFLFARAHSELVSIAAALQMEAVSTNGFVFLIQETNTWTALSDKQSELVLKALVSRHEVDLLSSPSDPFGCSYLLEYKLHDGTLFCRVSYRGSGILKFGSKELVADFRVQLKGSQ